jgi:hypothetical protein
MTDVKTPETTEDTNLAKKLAPEEVAALTEMHRQAQGLVQQVGQSEVRKARLLASLSEVEERAQAMMNAAASRLGIAPGTPWQMAPDGTVVILPTQPTVPAAPPAQTH